MPEKHPSTEPYPPELERRAVRMVQETIEQNNGEQFGVVGRVALQLRIGEESRFKQAQVTAERGDLRQVPDGPTVLTVRHRARHHHRQHRQQHERPSEHLLVARV